MSWKSRCFIQNAIMIFLSLFKSFLWILIFLKCVHPAQSESYAEPIVFFRIVFLNLWGFVFWIPKQYILYISSAWWVNRCSVLCEWFFLFLFWRKKKKAYSSYIYYNFMMSKMSLWHQSHDVSKKGDEVYVETGRPGMCAVHHGYKLQPWVPSRARCLAMSPGVWLNLPVVLTTSML